MPIIHRVHQRTIQTGTLVWGPLAGSFTYLDDGDTARVLNLDSISLRLRTYAPRAGTLTHVGVYVTVVTGTPPAYELGVMAEDRTPLGGSALTSHTFTEPGWHWIELSTGATVATGDYVTVGIDPGSTAPDASNCITVNESGLMLPQLMTPNMYRRSGTSWYRIDGIGSLTARYAEGDVLAPGIMSHAVTSFTSATEPDERGNVFTLPFAAQCHGCAMQLRGYYTVSDFQACLYDEEDNLLTSQSVDVSERLGSGSTGLHQIHWPSVDLAADTTYRLTLKPLASQRVDYVQPTFADAASRLWFTEGVRWQGTSRTDEGEWTDDPLSLFGGSLLLSSITVTE